MSSKSHKKLSQARAAAVALLYSSDITDKGVVKIVEGGAYPTEDFEVPEYAEELVRGVAAHRRTIDKYLSQTSENWALDRMPVVDRAILRLAVYEMLFEDNVPVSVAINEAVELAKAYGGEDESSRFVNGVLGRIARNLEAAGGVVVDVAEEKAAAAEAAAAAAAAGEPADAKAAEGEAAESADAAATAEQPSAEDATADKTAGEAVTIESASAASADDAQAPAASAAVAEAPAQAPAVAESAPEGAPAAEPAGAQPADAAAPTVGEVSSPSAAE